MSYAQLCDGALWSLWKLLRTCQYGTIIMFSHTRRVSIHGASRDKGTRAARELNCNSLNDPNIAAWQFTLSQQRGKRNPCL
jgi:hypothetical protein